MRTIHNLAISPGMSVQKGNLQVQGRWLAQRQGFLTKPLEASLSWKCVLAAGKG